MKSNLISAIAGWKSAALLALVAMVAAVAFSGVLTSTESADAQAADYNSNPGKTVAVQFDDITSPSAGDDYRISADSEGSATFVANGGTSILCTNRNLDGNDDGNADGVDDPTTTGTDEATTDPVADPDDRNVRSVCDTANGLAVGDDGNDLGNADANRVTLLVRIDDDSPRGRIFVERRNRTGGEFVFVEGKVIQVNPLNPAAALRGGPPSAAAIDKDGSAPSNITVTLTNAIGLGIGSEAVLVTTSRGVLTSGEDCANESACTLLTAAGTGSITVALTGNGATGTAEVVFRHLASGLNHTAEVVVHGDPASISAAADQGTIAIGGSTFIVVTIVDAEGNPTVGKHAGVNSGQPLVPGILGPEVPAGDRANPVTSNLNVDRNYPGVANDIPACGNQLAVVDDAATTDVDESTLNLQAADGTDVGSGTNTAGQCVIQVTAPDEPGAANDATRGTHTVAISSLVALGGDLTPRIDTVTVEIQVGGSPASIESDSPGRVDSLSSTSITVTVLDDEGVRVGAVPITVIKVEGSGQVDDVATGMTSDGRASFTYLAPLTPGEAVFLIRAGDAAKGQQIQDTITLAIGPEPEVAPEAPPATWNNELVSGQNYVVWNGADGADPSEGAAEGVSAIWSYNSGSGSWDGYFPDAADVPGGNTLTSLSNNQSYVVIVD
ncbi:MAG: hypothetical protein OXE43_09505 [Chloroflexi bacterium]|nr:hypothetical protein [Chloroflexota bacterium]